MANIISKLLLAASIVVAPVAASALTVTGASGASTCSVAFGSSAYSVDVLAGAHVNAAFDGTEAAGVTCFDLTNTSTSTAVVTVALVTVNQHGLHTEANSWGWLGGIQVDVSNVGIISQAIIAEGASFQQTFSFLIAAGTSVLFDWTYGAAYASGAAAPQFDFTVAATVVPVPAAGFLLLGALGGLGALRRRRKTA